MIPHIRKLLNTSTSTDDVNGYSTTERRVLNATSSPLTELRRHHDQADYDATVRRPTAPFDSSMALTILVLLTALFFMGFFSIYIRRFADDSPVDAARRRRRLRTSLSSSPHISAARKGADPGTVMSLPVIPYGGDTKLRNSDCAICLGEFETTESVKVIPYCAHVFHRGCIDTWLSSHATCPLCRTTRFFPVLEDRSLVVDINAIDRGGAASPSNRPETTAAHGDDDTRTSTVRRINSYSSFSVERVTPLPRTLSF